MKKIILWIAIIFLLICIISPILLELLRLEFRERNAEQFFEEFRFWGILICILLSLAWTIKRTDKLLQIVLKVVGTIGVAVLVFSFMAASVLSDLCDWSDREILFVNKNNEKVKIIRREYGCGAVDGSAPTIVNFEVKEIGKFFITSRKINIEEIEESEWMESENKK